jgi:hypothetical protein
VGCVPGCGCGLFVLLHCVYLCSCPACASCLPALPPPASSCSAMAE